MRTQTIVLIAAISAAFTLLYYEAMVHVFLSWSTLWGAHGPLILMVSVYLAWIKRNEARQLQQQPAILPGGILLAAGCFMLFAGKISSTMVVQQLSMVPVLLGILLLLAGYSFMKTFFLPISYLIFLTGFIEQMLGNAAIYFQQFTAWLAVLLLKLAGFQVFHDGTLIMLPHISLEVVRSCSGISHIVALLSLALPLAYMTQRTMTRKIILTLSALLIGIFANGLRVALIGIYALYNHGAELHGPAETLYVSFIFFFGLVALIILSRLLNRKDMKDPSRGKARSFNDQSSFSKFADNTGLPGKRTASFFVAGIIFMLTLGLIHFYHPQYVELKRPLDLLPVHIAGFAAKDLDQMHERIRPFPAEIELMRLYKNDQGGSFELYIGYFGIQDRQNRIIDYRRSWMHLEASRLPVTIGNGTAQINKTRLFQQSSNSAVYFWYQVDNRIITSEYWGKFYTFLDSLFKRKNNAAVIVIKGKASEKEIISFLEEALPLIRNHLSGR